jgi:hypothetical protein
MANGGKAVPNKMMDLREALYTKFQIVRLEQFGTLLLRHYRSPAWGDRITVRPGTLCLAKGERGNANGCGRGSRLVAGI